MTLLRWVAATRPSKRRRARVELPREVGGLLEEAEVSAEVWGESVWNLGRRFRQAAGQVSSLTREARRRGQNWLQGRGPCQASFG